MDLKEITDNQIMQILVKILFEEYKTILSDVQRAAGKETEQNKIREKVKEHCGLDIGEENGRLKGFIIGPENPLLSYVGDEIKFESLASINQSYSSMFEYFQKVVSKDGAILVSQDAIAHGLLLDGMVIPAKKIVGRNLEEITKMYIEEPLKPVGRMKTSIAAAVLLGNHYKIETKEKVNARLVDHIFCKRQTITRETYSTFTGPIYLYFKDRVGSAEFIFQTLGDCKDSMIKMHTQKGKFRDEYFFDKSEKVVGVIRIHEYSEMLNRAVIKEEHLIKPENIGIHPQI